MFQPVFVSADEVINRINAYFDYINGEFHFEHKTGKQTKGDDELTVVHKVWDRDAEPATFSGLALFLGFSSRQAYDDFIETGKFGEVLKWGKLRIEASYERKLHNQSSTGAIFALKSMGWNERIETNSPDLPKTLQVEILEAGPHPAANEKEVVL